MHSNISSSPINEFCVKNARNYFFDPTRTPGLGFCWQHLTNVLTKGPILSITTLGKVVMNECRCDEQSADALSPGSIDKVRISKLDESNKISEEP